MNLKLKSQNKQTLFMRLSITSNLGQKYHQGNKICYKLLRGIVGYRVKACRDYSFTK
jgi:hypothetical protein